MSGPVECGGKNRITPRGYASGMAEPRKIVSAAEMDKMTPQERADAVDAGILHDWNEVEPSFRRRVEEKGRLLAARLHPDG